MENKKEVILSTNHLSKRFGKRWAVKDLNLTIYKGDIFGLLGPNGAGKSTTIRMIIGLIFPTGGKILINNQPIKSRQTEARRNIRALIEGPDFYEYLSGLNNLKIMARLSGIKDQNIIDKSLKTVGLYPRRHDRVKSYSRGMKQRLGIAQAILDKPELIILDEPTTGLDPQGIREIRQLIYNLNSQHNITFIISSHILQEIENTCNRMSILHEGDLLAQGKLDKLLKGKSLEDYFISLTHKSEEIS